MGRSPRAGLGHPQAVEHGPAGPGTPLRRDAVHEPPIVAAAQPTLQRPRFGVDFFGRALDVEDIAAVPEVQPTRPIGRLEEAADAGEVETITDHARPYFKPDLQLRAFSIEK